MADSFAQFGGMAEEQQASADPFASFGGKLEGTDPFAQFGGQQHPPQVEDQSGGVLSSKPITDADIQAIAKKNNLTPEQAADLRSDIGWMGGQAPQQAKGFGWEAIKEDIKEGAKTTAGKFGKGVLLGIPQKVYRSIQDPNYERSLDDLNDLIHEKRSYAEAFGEMAPGLAVGAGLSKAASALPKGIEKAYEVVSPIAGGATAGLGESRRGEELESTALGAGVGAAVSSAIPIARGISRYFSPAEDEIAEAAARKIKIDEGYIGDTVEKKLAERVDEFAQNDRLVLTPDGHKELATAEKEIDRLADKELSIPDELKTQKRAIAEMNELANRIENPRVENQFKSYSVEEASKIIKAHEKEQGSAFVKGLLDDNRRTNAAVEAIGEKGSKEDYGLIRDNLEKVIDGQFKHRAIERRLGLPVVETGLNLSKQLKKFSIAKDSLLGNMERLPQIRDVEYPLVTKAIEAGKADLLPDNLKVFAKGYREAWDKALETAKGLGIPVKKMDNYVRHAVLPADETIGKLAVRVNELEKELGHAINNKTVTDANIHALMDNSPKFKELIDSVEYLQGKGGSVMNTKEGAAAEFFKDLQNSMNPKFAKEGFGLSAKAAKARESVVPDLIRENNPYRLYDGWVQNTLKTAYLREPIQKLVGFRNAAIKANLKNDAQYLDNLIADLSTGRRKTVANEIRDAITEYKIKARKAAAAQGKPDISDTANMVDDVLRSAVGQVYPNYLGLNPASLVQNLAQPIVQTIPELGHRYGALTGTKAMFRVLNTLREGEDILLSREGAAFLNKKYAPGISKGQMKEFVPGESYHTRNPALILENQGLKTHQISNDMADHMLSEMTKSNKLRAPMKMLKKANNALMYFYENSESINRLLVKGMADEMAKDLMKGSGKLADLAVKAVNREFPSSVRAALQKGIQAGDQKAVANTLTEYLHNKTLYNYDKANLSALARYMGPLFTAFSKFPLSLAGDFYDRLATKGAVKGSLELLRKYAPLPIALYTLDQYIGDKGEKPAGYETLVGRGGLAGTTPVMGLKSLAEGRMGPPFIHQAIQGGMALAQLPTGNLQPSWSWINTVAKSYLPGSRIWSIITDDVPSIVTGEKPQGTFIGKGIPGLDEAIQGTSENIQETLYNK